LSRVTHIVLLGCLQCVNRDTRATVPVAATSVALASIRPLQPTTTPVMSVVRGRPPPLLTALPAPTAVSSGWSKSSMHSRMPCRVASSHTVILRQADDPVSVSRPVLVLSWHSKIVCLSQYSMCYATAQHACSNIACIACVSGQWPPDHSD
jgi:hypothetical protein